MCELVHTGLGSIGRIRFSCECKALEQCFHGMLRLRSSRQMLRQAIITSKTANAIAVANTAMIVANERTYITPYANVRNMPFAWTEKAPAIDGRGPSAPSSRVIPVSLLIEHYGFIHFDERPLDYRLRQSVPLQCLIIEPHQHFELSERCLPKSL